MESQIENFKPTNDIEINIIVENYFKRQKWMETFINPKNSNYKWEL